MTPDLPPPLPPPHADEAERAAPDPVEVSLRSYVRDACSAESVDVSWTGLSADRLPQGDVSLVWSGDPCRPRPTLRVAAVRGGAPVWRVTVTPSITVWVTAPVAARDFQVGEAVEATQGRVRMDGLVGETRTEGIARIPLPAGAPLTSAGVSPRIDARSGADVSVVLARGGLRISAPGRLLHDAAAGDEVRVANAATRQVLTGVLVNETTVEVR